MTTVHRNTIKTKFTQNILEISTVEFTLMAHYVFFCSSIATPVRPLLLCSPCLTYLLNLLWPIKQEMLFMSIFMSANFKEKKRGGVFLVKPLAYSVRIRTPFQSGTPRWSFSLELLRSLFDVFSRIAIIWKPCK